MEEEKERGNIMKEFKVKEVRYIPRDTVLADSIWEGMKEMGIKIETSDKFTCMWYEEEDMLIIVEPVFKREYNGKHN